MKKKELRILIVLVTILVAGTIFFLFDPNTTVGFLQCPLKKLTGYSCPLCGTQRALHALLHGEWGLALHYNYFLPLLLAYFLLRLGLKPFSANHLLDRVFQWLTHKRTGILLLFLAMLWMILRNSCFGRI